MITEIEKLYRPFRTFASTLSVSTSLLSIWRTARYLDANSLGQTKPFPFPEVERAFGKSNPFELTIYQWDVELLAREALMHGSVWGSQSLVQWSSFATGINHIRRIEDGMVPLQLQHDPDAVLKDIHRIAHRQFPWQSSRHGNVVRYWKILSDPVLSAALREITGLDTTQLMRMALLTFGHFLDEPLLRLGQDYSSLGINSEVATNFLLSISERFDSLRTETLKAQKYDFDWVYSFNPLVAKPFLRVSHQTGEYIQCLFPTLALNRMSERLHHDLMQTERFGVPIGSAFENYIFEYAERSLPKKRFAVSPETPYRIGKQTKHGVDLIIEDGEAAIFIECKTKRLTVPGKFASDGVKLGSEIDTLASMVIKHYRNVLDALDGKTTWQVRACKIFVLIVTLDDWRLFGIHTPLMVAAAIKKALVARGMDEGLWDRMPCLLVSADDFEIATDIMTKTGIEKFFDKFASAEFRGWPLRGFALQHFAEHMKRKRRSPFQKDFNAMLRVT